MLNVGLLLKHLVAVIVVTPELKRAKQRLGQTVYGFQLLSQLDLAVRTFGVEVVVGQIVKASQANHFVALLTHVGR